MFIHSMAFSSFPGAAVDCGNPGTPSHSSRFGSSFTYQSSVSFTCSLGFTVLGQSEIVCLANGHWSAPSPQCRPIQCPVLKLPTYSHVNTTNRTFSAAVKFSCFTGFQLQGMAVISCQADTQWSSSSPTCTAISCPSLSPSANAYFISMNTSYLGLAVQTCLQYYRHTAGSVSRLCQANSLWSGSPIVCEGEGLSRTISTMPICMHLVSS